MGILCTVDFCSGCGVVRALNGVNLGPDIAEQSLYDDNQAFADLKIPQTRLHDVPLNNPGMRLVDIQHIFGNWEADENNPDNYYFSQTDDYIANILKLNSKIVYRLGTSIEHSIRHYYSFPPADYRKWITICANIIRHYNEGWNRGFSWNIEYWEIWNEPNAKPQMWNGDDVCYYSLYTEAAKKLKERFPSIKIGGPSLSCPVQYDAPLKYTDDFLDFCRRENVPLDFYSWHCYPVNLEQIVNEPARVRRVLDRFGFTKTELHLNEWHYTPKWLISHDWIESPVQGNNSAKAAAFIGNVLTQWQDSPLDVGGYYTGNANRVWGLLGAEHQKYKTWYAFRAFADLLKTPLRIHACSSSSRTSILAGRDADNLCHAVMICAFKELDDAVFLKGILCPERFKVYRLDMDHDLAEEPAVLAEDGTVILKKPRESTLFLLKDFS